ncbi:MAG TPA: four-carbon acid sugar kinase family protein [Chthoniobacterales bacterium]|nr:four-carbon acid sugar kinase family protein [Chthoniobacterales bacterium]
MKAHCIMLADDLSGAADCAVPFARAGFSPEVFLQPECAARTDARIVSIDLNTRELTPGQAVQITSRILRLIPSTRETVWYQKIDSTLRGNIGPDVLATVRAIPLKRVIFCAPAFPDTGRTTVQGRVFVNGLPLEKSGVNTGWLTGKSISDLFAEVGLNTRAFSLDVIRSGSSNILRHLENSPGVTVAVCDAETNNDLLAIAKAGLQIREESIFVGSAGLAHQIATLLGTEQRFENHPVLPDKPILVVVGSKSPASRAQFEHLSNLSGIDLLRLPVTALKSESDSSITNGLTRALAGGRDVAITTELTESLNDQQGAGLMQALGRTLRPFLDKFSGLVLTGGETARGLLSESEIDRLRMMDEIEPGVTLSVTVGKLELPIVMKAGAFGTQATLLNAVHFLRSRKK